MTGNLATIFRQFRREPRARIGLWVLTLLAVTAIFAPGHLPDPNAITDPLAGARPPGAGHPFGTDELSRDVFARVVSGAGISLRVAAFAAALAVGLGALVGVVAGYLGGWIDAILMRMVEAALAIPRLFILLLLLALWEPIPLPVLIIVLGATGWFGTSRIVRGEVLRLREETYVHAAHALGAPRTRIIFRHLLPNTLGALLVAATLGVGDVLLIEAGLSFLGLGIPRPQATWGGMIFDSKGLISTAPWISLFPGLAIVVTVVAVSLVGEALRDAFDPKNA